MNNASQRIALPAKNTQRLGVFDCDEVLFDLTHRILSMLHRRTGRHHIRSEHLTRFSSLCEIFGVEWEQVAQWMIEEECLESCTLNPWASIAIEMTREAGLSPVILTSRGWHPSGEGITLGALGAADIEVDEAYFLDVHESKRETLASLGDVAFFVDDNADHIHDSASLDNVHTPVLMSRHWNNYYSPQPGRVASVNSLEDFVCRVRRGELTF